MKTEQTPATHEKAPTLSVVDGVLSLSDLCAQLHVSAQTIYDLRSQGRGPRGFRVGRELRFRAGEIDAWLARLEAEDDRRHHGGQSLMGRPRIPIGTFGHIAIRRRGDRSIAETRIRDADGRMRQVRITASSAAQARMILKERLLARPGFGSAGVLRPDSGSPISLPPGWPISSFATWPREPSRAIATS